MEDLLLLFREMVVCVVIADGKEVFFRWGFGGFAKVFGEFVDDVAGVFFHAEGDLAVDRVVDIRA